MTQKMSKKNWMKWCTHGHQKNNMCFNGEKFKHHRIGDNLGVEKYSYKDPNGML